jgi:hypothetical protein
VILLKTFEGQFALVNKRGKQLVNGFFAQRLLYFSMFPK